MPGRQVLQTVILEGCLSVDPNQEIRPFQPDQHRKPFLIPDHGVGGPLVIVKGTRTVVRFLDIVELDLVIALPRQAFSG